MNKDVFDEYKKMADGLSEINTNRGGSADGLKGFYAEQINASESNIERIKKDIKAKELVIDNNGAADAIVRYSNGQFGREIQDKCGYTFYRYKNWLTEGKYDGMILRINKDHPLFENEEQYKQLKKLAKEHNVRIIKAKTSEDEMKKLAEKAVFEGKIRDKLNLDDGAPIVHNLYVGKRMTSDFIDDITHKFISNDLKALHKRGMDEAISSAMFASALSVTQNTVSVVKGDEEVSEALKSIFIDTSSAVVLGYAAGVTMEKLAIERGDASLLVTGTIQISKQMISYVNGDIDEQQLIDGVAETTAYLVAAHIGRNIGGLVGETIIPIPVVGAYIGQCIGEMITTAVCAEVISTIKFSKEFDKQNSKIIVLYKQAEEEIRASQVRLESLIQRENEMLSFAIKEGVEKIVSGILNDSYVQIEDGIMTIGERFQLSKEELTEGEVTQENLFLDSDDVLIIR